jgi:hypothetical protein
MNENRLNTTKAWLYENSSHAFAKNTFAAHIANDADCFIS